MRCPFVMLAASMLAALVGTARAQDRVQVGVLECRGAASIGFVVGSVTNLGCVLRVEGLPEDRYIATIRKVGLDLGITQETALAWGVYAPVVRLGPGALAGGLPDLVHVPRAQRQVQRPVFDGLFLRRLLRLGEQPHLPRVPQAEEGDHQGDEQDQALLLHGILGCGK